MLGGRRHTHDITMVGVPIHDMEEGEVVNETSYVSNRGGSNEITQNLKKLKRRLKKSRRIAETGG